MESILARPRPSAWESFRRSPLLYLARKLYRTREVIPRHPISDPITVVCISDTHNSQAPLPDGQVLIHAGDLTQSGTLPELQAALDWLKAQPHAHKIVIAGNHDTILDPSRDLGYERARLDWEDIIYLCDESVTIRCSNGRRLHIYGSPLSPRHGNWAFQYPRSEDMWAGKVPEGVDILITHGPPLGHLDLMRLGCSHLLRELWRTRPLLHVFGHVHEGYGQEWLGFDGLQEAFEQVVMSRGLRRILDLGRLAFEVFWASLRQVKEAPCPLVNAAMVGGLWDKEMREPITVVI
ncbi:metallophosphoesterase domain-containing protein [Diaporthe helianthi]|uniref:Metallophosphoesterase domain-containing protein n=1 Tax=Diaporthe helianthi TaxID=158607 RepID=A0A2P5I814_DIAHE|nr:metallophosphoesterase domain-containing protein [Diaporthe helianthi]